MLYNDQKKQSALFSYFNWESLFLYQGASCCLDHHITMLIPEDITFHLNYHELIDVISQCSFPGQLEK